MPFLTATGFLAEEVLFGEIDAIYLLLGFGEGENLLSSGELLVDFGFGQTETDDIEESHGGDGGFQLPCKFLFAARWIQLIKVSGDSNSPIELCCCLGYILVWDVGWRRRWHCSELARERR